MSLTVSQRDNLRDAIRNRQDLERDNAEFDRLTDRLEQLDAQRARLRPALKRIPNGTTVDLAGECWEVHGDQVRPCDGPAMYRISEERRL